jgi:hypothetical protein
MSIDGHLAALDTCNYSNLKQTLLSSEKLRLTFTNGEWSAPIAARQTSNFRRSNQRVSIITRELNFCAHLCSSSAQNETASRHYFSAMDCLHFHNNGVRVTGRSDARELASVSRLGCKDAQSIFQLWISAFIAVPTFWVFSMFI